MCGIVGFSLRPGGEASAASLGDMARCIAHRGPDDHGTFLDHRAGVGLAMNRLAIIDLSSAGHQPMTGRDGSVLVFNGEVYNFQELRSELIGLGHRFVSRTDTEVVLRAFEQWGRSAVSRFNGMFALALFSAAHGELFLARDPLGMKPLYYTEIPGGLGLAFASEIKAFKALPGFRAAMNPSALAQYLEMGFTYDDHETSLVGVYKLPPGHFLVVRNGVPDTPVSYFAPPVPDAPGARSQSEREQELFATLSETVSQHLIADVPLGVLLSGGLDSSVVAALARREGKVTTLSMGFADSAVDERSHGRLVAELIGSEHIDVLFEPKDVFGEIEDAIASVDDLFGDWGVITTRLLYKRARKEGLKVVLVGEGSDELFGGYPQFALTADGGAATIGAITRLYRRYCGRRWGRGFFRFRRQMLEYLRQSDGDFFHAVRLFETRSQLPNNYVMKVDKASMSVSVEARTPFLDPRVASVALRTPREFLLREGTNKFLLRSTALRFGLLPREVAFRAKFGGSIAASWMDDSPAFRQYARAVILEREGWADRLGFRGAMTRFFDHGQKGYAFPHPISIFSNLAWRLLLLGLWSRRYLGWPSPEVAAHA